MNLAFEFLDGKAECMRKNSTRLYIDPLIGWGKDCSAVGRILAVLLGVFLPRTGVCRGSSSLSLSLLAASGSAQHFVRLLWSFPRMPFHHQLTFLLVGRSVVGDSILVVISVSMFLSHQTITK